MSRWLGYRETPSTQPVYSAYLWSFIGAFCGLSLLQAIFGQIQYFIDRKVPPIIASYGASAVLCYGVIESPLAQPRPLMIGHFLSALTAVCITKLFGLLGPERFEDLRWLAGSLSAAMAIVVMQITKTTHPPAGATALLAAVDRDVQRLSWYLLPVVLLSSSIILVTALLVNNIQRRFPVFWIEPTATADIKPSIETKDSDVEAKPMSQIPVSRSSSLTVG